MNGRSRRKSAGAAAMLLALGISIAPHAAAQPSPDIAPFYAFGGFALFGPDSNDQLRGERGGAGFNLGGGFRFSRLLSFELGVLGAGYRLDTPPSAAPAAGTFKDGTLRTNLWTGGLNLSVKFHFTQGRVDPYFGAGAGLYTTNFRTTSEASTCKRQCADTGPRITSRSRDAGYHALIGVDDHVTQKDVSGVEIRQLRLNANFDDIVLGEVKAGGSLLWLGYRRYF